MMQGGYAINPESHELTLDRWSRLEGLTLWHVLQVKSRQEKALAENLTSMEIEHYLPLTDRIHFYGTRKFRVTLPLFPGYMFLRCSVEQAFQAANRTRRVVRVLRVADQAAFERDLQNLRLAIEGKAKLDIYPFLSQGTRVEVRAGPFRGLQGVVETKSRANHLILQIEMLGRAVSMEMDCSLLEPVS